MSLQGTVATLASLVAEWLTKTRKNTILRYGDIKLRGKIRHTRAL